MNIRRMLYIVICVLVCIITSIAFALTFWFNKTFGVSIEEILYTISSPLKGADTNFVNAAIPYVIMALVITAPLVITLLFVEHLVYRTRKKDVIILAHLFEIMFISAYVSLAVIFVDDSLDMSSFIYDRTHETTIYQDYYIDPNDVSISSENTKNIIYIYIESMETTYASTEDGGYQEINYIPELTRLANENISFSNSDKLGGWRSTSGTGWTMGALFTTQTGIPFSFPIEGNSISSKAKFASGVTALGDILNAEGYYLEFLCGSDASFAGRNLFFEQHGDFELMDYYWAKSNGYFDPDRYVWWGFEDQYLYKIAKDRLTDVSQSDQPFCYEMLTVDTHHVSGYICDLCDDEYSEQLANVLACADNQINEFITWCQEQDWYEDTVIIISGDHPRMDSDLVGNVSYTDRTVYNCFINVDSEITNTINTNNREFTAMDIFPTILAAAGHSIDGDRLGLGTNLFSDKSTLSEDLGADYLDQETARYSSYYIKAFE